MLRFRTARCFLIALAAGLSQPIWAANEPQPKSTEAPVLKVTQQDLGFVGVPDVQREIGMTADQASALSDLWRRHQDLLAQLRQAGGTKEEYLAQMQAHQLEYEAKARELLGEKQSRRLVQVAMQLDGHRLLARASLKQPLSLSDQQTARLAEIQKRRQDEASKEFLNTRNIEGGNPKARGDAIARLIALDARTENEMLEVLLPDQRKRLEAMLGPPAAFRQAFLDRQHQLSN